MLKAPFQLSVNELACISNHLRLKVFEICKAARSGHIGGSSGAVELFATLYFGGILRYAPSNPYHPERDRVLARGHLGPVRYPIFSLLGWLEEEELQGYRSIGSRLHGHEDHLTTPGVDLTPSGSLGMLLSYGVGSAVSAKDRDLSYMTYVFIGDGEEQEGNVSEAARHAAHLKLDNLIGIIDRNGKQLSDPVESIDTSDLARIWEGYGWNIVYLDDGHDYPKTLVTYHAAMKANRDNRRPTVIIADTVKGYGLDGCENHFSGYHTTSTCKSEVVDLAIRSLQARCEASAIEFSAIKQKLREVHDTSHSSTSPFVPVELDGIRPGPETPNHPDFCQVDYFKALKKEVLSGSLKGQRLYFLTADVTRLDTVEALGLREFCRYHNLGIREQHTIAFAHGLSLTDPSARIVINTFDAFTYRAIDQLNAAAQGGSSLVIIADTAGLTNAQNGRTHQSSGQPGAILAMPGVTFLEPWDANDTFHCLNWAVGESRGPVYIRVHSSPVSVLVPQGIERNLESYIVWEPDGSAEATIVASGMTVSSALEAAMQSTVRIRVINLVNHKSPGSSLLQGIEPGKPLLTVYNGHADVLLGNVAKRILELPNSHRPSVVRGLGFEFGTTGKVDDLKRCFGLDIAGILSTVNQLIA